ncbi:MAG: MogA/MoaB family molybdenum cofactor biosynthesis protein [Syntrophaceae bacterium]|nr:MogA/MoaB family molybdenum cofactor biosynthesis protein [Syntrophaceae bacterium]
MGGCRKGFRGDRADLSGKEIIRILDELDFSIEDYRIIPDEKDIIKSTILEFSDARKFDLVITTGGTGVSPRDVTPDATLEVIEREIPGMAEAMRRESLLKTPHAMISRAVAGIRGESLIINLPGSPRGARENLTVILPALKHTIEKIKGDQSDCVPV